MNATINPTIEERYANLTEPRGASRRRGAIWTGRVLSGLAVLFLTLDAGIKLIALPAAVEATAQLGYPLSSLFSIGLIELACLILYLIPRTAFVGAVLWTGYLGGAIASHLRLADPLFSHTLFPTYVATLLWVGLWLRDRRVNALFAAAYIGS